MIRKLITYVEYIVYRYRALKEEERNAPVSPYLKQFYESQEKLRKRKEISG